MQIWASKKILHWEIPDHHTQIEDNLCNIGSISLGQHYAVDKWTPLISCLTWHPPPFGGIFSRLWDSTETTQEWKKIPK